MKWVALRPEVDRLDGTIAVDERWTGPSPADEAALEWGLRIAAANSEDSVVVTAGPIGAESMLRDALACGATTAIRIATDETSPASVDVSIALADVLRPLAPRMVLCGDWSVDRGSGSVPPFLAAELGIGQACGLVGISISERALDVERRLDGGRREQLTVIGRAVLSVEGATARLRRATLAATLTARSMPIAIAEADNLVAGPVPTRVEAFRPRARVLEGPSTDLGPRERAEQLIGAQSNRTPPQRLELDPAAAADRILSQLADWGYALPTRTQTPTPLTTPTPPLAATADNRPM